MTKLKELFNQLTTFPIIGLDLGSAALKAVEVAYSPSGEILLRRAVVVRIDEKVSPLFIKRTLADAGFKTLNVAVGISSPELVARSFQFPLMPKKELNQAIQIEAEHTILNGHTLDDMAIDWHAFPLAGESIRGILAVVPKTVMEKRTQNFKSAGVHLRIVDVEGLALWNAYWILKGKKEAVSKTVLLINIGAGTTNLVIAKGPDELMLVRDFALGERAFANGQGKDWGAEIADSLGYARSKAGLRTLDTVYMTGGGSGPHVLPFLKPSWNGPVTFWNPLEQISRDSEASVIQDSQGPLLTIAIGLALRQPL